MGVHAVQRLDVVAGGFFNGRGGVLADIQAQQHGATLGADLRAAHISQKGIQPFIVEAQTIDQRVLFRNAEHTWLGVARLWAGRDRTHFHKAKAHGSQRVNAASILVQSSSHAYAVRKFQTRQLNGVVHHGARPGALQRRVLPLGHEIHGEVVGGFGVHAE